MSNFSLKPAVRDSFDEEEASDDVDDEVFIRDGRNGFKADEDSGVKKPLMPLRRRQKYAKFTSNLTQEPKKRCKIFLVACCYGIGALSILLGLIALSVIVINYFSLPLSQIQGWFANRAEIHENKSNLCTNLTVKDVWVQSFPKLTSETGVRLNDINHDGILDVIIGYGTGADGRNVPDFVCELYFGRDPPCLGGIVALDGQTGKVLWQHWTRRPVFSVDCSADLTSDGVSDCIIGGKGGLLHAINGHDGSLLWHLENDYQDQPTEVVLDVYAAQYIPDIDGDGFIDVISAHTVSDISGNTVKGHLIIVSGKEGHIVRMIEMPGGSESYYPPQLLTHLDGQKIILVGTGGTASHSWGGLHAIPLSQLAGTDKVPFQTLITSDSKGVMSPPVLVDITHDGIEDIVVSLFNSTVVALDGKTFQTLWNYTFESSQSFSSPTPGFFNEDDTPDFLVKYQHGPDFPAYYYSEMNILDGKTGQPFLKNSVIDSVGSQMGGLSLSVEGLGNDWFLYWSADCAGYERSQSQFSFAKGSDIVAQSQADLCHLRFNSSMVATLFAISQHHDPPGFPIYSSDKRVSLEYSHSEEAFDGAARYLATHPDFWSTFGVPENSLKPNVGDAFANGREKPSAASKDDQTRTSDVNEEKKDVEAENPSGSSFSQVPTRLGSVHRKPINAAPDIRDWRFNQAPKGFGSLYGSRTPDGDEDYENPMIPNGEAQSQINNAFNKYLSDVTNEQDADQQNPSYSNQFMNQQRLVRRPRASDGIPHSHTNGNKLHRKPKDDIESAEKKIDKAELLTASSGAPMGKQSGVYPLTSTGSFAPPLSGSGIDLVLVSYWIPPSLGVYVVTERDVECVKQGIARAAADNSEKYVNLDAESLELSVTAECLYQQYSSSGTGGSTFGMDRQMEPHPGFLPKTVGKAVPTYDALNLHLGQLTVYRFNLQCKCDENSSGEDLCARILPYQKQRWPSFMGRDGRGYFYPK